MKHKLLLALTSAVTCLAYSTTDLAHATSESTFHKQLLRINISDSEAELLAKNLALSPGSELTRGFETMTTGDYKKATVLFGQAIQKAPKSADAHLWLGLAYSYLHKSRAALDEFNIAAEIAPQVLTTLCLSGSALMAQNQFEPALRKFDQALSVDSNNIGALSGKISCFDRTRRHEDAANLALKLVELYPASSAAHVVRGSNLLCRMTPDDQEQIKANAASPEEYEQKMENAIEKKKADTAEALKNFDEAVRLDPDNISALSGKAGCLISLGDFKQVVALTREEIKRRPKSSVLHAILGLVLSQSGSLSEAVSECQLSIKLDPDSYEGHDVLARCYRAMDKEEDAKTEFATAEQLKRTTAD